MQTIQQSPSKSKIESPSRYKTRQNDPHNLSIVTIHQLDSIYYGQINKSYNKEGFGILQTIEFQTYIGFWLNGKAQGVGLLVYPTGQVIYGQFSRNILNGIAVVDNQQYLRVGVFQGINNVGICFQYTYNTQTWCMKQYNQKGMPISQVKSQKMSLQDGIPEMLKLQHSIYTFFKNYIEGQYFNYVQQQNTRPKNKQKDKQKEKLKDKQKKSTKIVLIEAKQNKYSKLNQNVIKSEGSIIKIGFRDENGFVGLCCILDKQLKILKESGFYKKGALHGYGLLNSENQIVIGLYIQGSRQGVFTQYTNGLIMINQYKFNELALSLDISEEQAKKKQMRYNFQQKDFLSAKNSLEAHLLSAIFQLPETRIYKAKQNPILYKLSAQKTQKYLQKSLRESPIKQSPTKLLLSPNKQRPFSPEKKQQKSCMMIMRQKINKMDLQRLEKRSRELSNQKRGQLLNSNLKVFNQLENHQESYVEQSIAIQENPFDNVINGYNTLNNSSRKRY